VNLVGGGEHHIPPPLGRPKRPHLARARPESHRSPFRARGVQFITGAKISWRRRKIVATILSARREAAKAPFSADIAAIQPAAMAPVWSRLAGPNRGLFVPSVACFGSAKFCSPLAPIPSPADDPHAAPLAQRNRSATDDGRSISSQLYATCAFAQCVSLRSEYSRAPCRDASPAASQRARGAEDRGLLPPSSAPLLRPASGVDNPKPTWWRAAPSATRKSIVEATSDQRSLDPDQPATRAAIPDVGQARQRDQQRGSSVRSCRRRSTS
jgi:hypothetical protein